MKLSIERMQTVKHVLEGFIDGYDTVDDKENYEATRDSIVALDEIIAICELKGDQVPVSMDALRDTVAEMSGGLPMLWKEGCDKGHHAVPFINFNSLHRLVTKFTAPQKLVVLQRKVEAKFIDDFERGCIQGYNDAIDDIEAAGGVVKGGE